MIEKHYINLTNGIEWIPLLNVPYSFVRITSTDIEKDNWISLLRDLNEDLLLSLALGHTCHIYDCGTRRETSKTISKGLPFIQQGLHGMWNGFDVMAECREKQEMKRKLGYYRRFYLGKPIKLIGHSFATEHDGDVKYYRKILEQTNAEVTI